MTPINGQPQQAMAQQALQQQTHSTYDEGLQFFAQPHAQLVSHFRQFPFQEQQPTQASSYQQQPELNSHQQLLVRRQHDLLREIQGKDLVACARPTTVCPYTSIFDHANCTYCRLKNIRQHQPLLQHQVENRPILPRPVFQQPLTTSNTPTVAETLSGFQAQIQARSQAQVLPPIQDSLQLQLNRIKAAEAVRPQPQANPKATVRARRESQVDHQPDNASQAASTTGTPSVVSDGTSKKPRARPRKAVEPRTLPTPILGGDGTRWGDLVPWDPVDGASASYGLRFNGLFRFMDLPKEIRTRVYAYLVDNGEHGLFFTKEWKVYHQAPITRVNREIRSESLPLVYTINGFWAATRELCKAGPLFANAVKDERCKLIRHFYWFTAQRSIRIDLRFEAGLPTWSVTFDGIKGQERATEIFNQLSRRQTSRLDIGITAADIAFITGVVLRINTKD